MGLLKSTDKRYGYVVRMFLLVEVMEAIDAYMSMGEEKLNKWTSNLRSYTEELYELARKLKEDQLR